MVLAVQEQILKYSSTLTSAELYLLKQPQKGLILCFLWHWTQGGNPSFITGDSKIYLSGE